MYTFYLAFASGRTLPTLFNSSITTFIPKELEAGELDEVARSPSKTRPLTLSNCDNKIITGTYNTKLRTILPTCINRFQRGFIWGRQLLENLLQMDTVARNLDYKCDDGQCPILFLLDFLAACPSLNHEYLFLCLEYSRLPKKFINVIKALYKICLVYTHLEGSAAFMYVIL